MFKMKDSQLARKVLQEACYYAFVKFYSHFAAKKAKAFLSRNLKLGSQTCKVKKNFLNDTILKPHFPLCFLFYCFVNGHYVGDYHNCTYLQVLVFSEFYARERTQQWQIFSVYC